MEKKVSNEDIIAALMQYGTVRDAAAAMGITPQTICRRMQDSEFVAAYKAERLNVIRRATISINGKLPDAIEPIAEIMNNPEVTPETRLQAAQTIIDNSGILAERLANAEKKAETPGNASAFAFGF